MQHYNLVKKTTTRSTLIFDAYALLCGPADDKILRCQNLRLLQLRS